jgi:hypothetical protein
MCLSYQLLAAITPRLAANSHRSPGLLFTETSKSKSELLYDWRFTANKFVFVSSPLKMTTTDLYFFFQLNILSDEKMDLSLMLGLSSSLRNWPSSKSNQSQSHIATEGQSISKSRWPAPSGAHDQIFIILWQLRSCFCGAPSLTRGRICLLYMLLALASVVFLTKLWTSSGL